MKNIKILPKSLSYFFTTPPLLVIHLLLLLITGSFTVGSAFAQSNYKITISLGRHGEDCAGRGICGFTFAELAESKKYNSVAVKDSNLVIQADLQWLSGDELQKFLGSRSTGNDRIYYFIMEKEYMFSEMEKTTLYMNTIYTKIPVQIVPININGTRAEIKLTLKK